MGTIPTQLYPQTMQTFIAHWTQVNATLGASPLLLKAGYTLANFTADRTAIVAAMDAVIPAVNTQQGAITLRDQQKTAIKLRLTQFRAALAAFLPDSKYIRMLPTLPSLSVNETRFLAPFVDMSAVWNLVNTEVNAGFTPPLILPGAYTKALFDTDVTNLKNAFLAVENAVVGASALRGARDVLLPPAIQRMKQYRGAVVARLPVGSPLLNNIPSYTVNNGPAAQARQPVLCLERRPAEGRFRLGGVRVPRRFRVQHPHVSRPRVQDGQ